MRLLTTTASALALSTVPARSVQSPVPYKRQDIAVPCVGTAMSASRAVQNARRNTQDRSTNNGMVPTVPRSNSVGSRDHSFDDGKKQPTIVIISSTLHQAEARGRNGARTSVGTKDYASVAKSNDSANEPVALGTTCTCGADCWIIQKRDSTASGGATPNNPAQKGVDGTILVAAGLAISLVGAFLLTSCWYCGVFRCLNPKRIKKARNRQGRVAQWPRSHSDIEMGRR